MAESLAYGGAVRSKSYGVFFMFCGLENLVELCDVLLYFFVGYFIVLK